MSCLDDRIMLCAEVVFGVQKILLDNEVSALMESVLMTSDCISGPKYVMTLSIFLTQQERCV